MIWLLVFDFGGGFRCGCGCSLWVRVVVVVFGSVAVLRLGIAFWFWGGCPTSPLIWIFGFSDSDWFFGIGSGGRFRFGSSVSIWGFRRGGCYLLLALYLLCDSVLVGFRFSVLDFGFRFSLDFEFSLIAFLF